jgi:hypothetical protein
MGPGCGTVTTLRPPRRGGGWEAAARSAALHGPAAVAVAERARAQGWCWRDAQEVGVGDGVVVESSCVRPRFFIWRV